ncbi:MAG: replicative DNA helicase [Tissierellia bacterium]|nr:replicative DNA helicase [Tissierellia bacterium]
MGRIPPHNLDAEKSALGIMLLSQEKVNAAIQMLKPSDFYNEGHGHIYQSIQNLYNKSAPVDLISTSEELRRMGKLDVIGGMTYLAKLTSAVTTTLNIEYYLKIIKDKSLLRSLIEKSSQTIDSAYDDEEETSTIVEMAEKNIFEITQGAFNKGLVPLKEVLLESYKLMEQRAANPGGLTGMTTGFIDLDYKLSGMQKSDLILLAARPSMGKTALMVNITLNAALKGDAKVAVFSLEMSKEQLTQRMISAISHIDLQRVIGGRIAQDEWGVIANAVNSLESLVVSIDDTPAISPLEVKAKCRRMKAEHGLDLIVIDYLQLMEMGGKSDNRQQEISAISRSLKGIAKELDVPVVALSQLSRAVEGRTDKRPILSDLRESGAIEQDADVVMFLYRDDYYHEDSEKPNVGEVIIAKHRNGPTGVVELLFKPEYTKFVNLTYDNNGGV